MVQIERIIYRLFSDLAMVCARRTRLFPELA
jgi:hypothetical protein